MQGYLAAMRSYGQVQGRAHIAEFWGFFLVTSILGIILNALLDPGPGQSVWPSFLYLLFVLAHLVPYICVLARRLHDTDASGWWALIGLVPLVGFVMLIPAAFKGTVGPNRFGPEPANPMDGAPGQAQAGAPKRRREPSFSVVPTPRSEPAPRVATARTPAMTDDLVSQLEKLAQLRADGTLTQAEFDTMKARLMASEASR
ncbi:DUF805 domain-containing protein [Aureimonas sp. AU4]|uniref:DUF805 domain-containing protein n=1 Tax=Aureimonas sp. AU4 TaxID=1638163 RepID=UPI000780E085|nr:DUF805 domain-containing protein [Aureimonas sp. AU4]